MVKWKIDCCFIVIWISIIMKSTIHLTRDAQGWKLDFENVDIPDGEWQMYKRMIPMLISHQLICVSLAALKLESSFVLMVKMASNLLCMMYAIGFTLSVAVLMVCVGFWNAMQLLSEGAFLLLSLITVVASHNCDKVLKLPQDMIYYFHSIVCWNMLRGVSFYYDSRKHEKTHLHDYMRYVMYYPLLIFGPFITFDTFKRNEGKLKEDTHELVSSVIRTVILGTFMELISFVIPFRSMSEYVEIHTEMSLWAIGACVFWNGVFFSMKYKVIYGVSSAFAAWDGKTMHSLPCCTAYMYSYKKLWKKFDVGFNVFLEKYVYCPIATHFRAQYLNTNLVIITAKLLSFIVVFIWHGSSRHVFLWCLINFVVSAIEGWVTRAEKNQNFKMLKPILYMPLTMTSVMGNVIICASFGTMRSFISNIWNRGNYIGPALCIFCAIKSALAVESLLKLY